MAKDPLNLPGPLQTSSSVESKIPRTNVDILSNLPNSHEAVMESLGSMLSADVVGVCNEVLVPKVMDEVITTSGSSLQCPVLLPGDSNPTGCSEGIVDDKPCSDSLGGIDVSFEHHEVDAAALIVDVLDAGSLPGPLFLIRVRRPAVNLA
ncbi:hypothetical protein Nepgr_003838 [Nepenthes gracilis]|uniref:Uncharacterized protein n=1 Tax=Nepenthes gracilis TaxID=150966 RepID=A0AAD3S0E2_NEPGR|nr:hypothetical protein Nepgr_003838 [Nepenthes gracilis]